jgi:hypothetical protein
MTEDAKQLARTARRCIAEVQAVTRLLGPTGVWLPMYDAQVLDVTHVAGANANTAAVRLSNYRWDETPYALNKGALVRIRTADGDTVLFEGVFTQRRPAFSGGAEKGGAFEHNDILCADYRWLLHRTSVITGQIARGMDDYTDFGQAGQAAVTNGARFMTGRRTIFNPGGKPNRDPVALTVSSYPGYTGSDGSYPVFCPPRAAFADGSSAQSWTAGQMMHYIFSFFYNEVWSVFPVNPFAGTLVGITGDDWDTVLSGIVVDGLSPIEAADLVCRHIGWTFRQQDDLDGAVFVFYKIGAAGDYTKRHDLHAPAVDEDIAAAVSAGLYLCSDAEIIDDLDPVVNAPVGLGAPEVYEFAAELVPAWQDSDLVPDADNLFFTEADLLAMETPDDKSFYNKYHPRGAAFLRDVGRKWTLNETGAYTLAATFDRGDAFDFATVLPAARVYPVDKRLWAPFPRPFLDPLTFDAAEALTPAAIKVEFSFDGGTAWQHIDCVVDNLKGEAGIRINEPNLSQIAPPGEPTIAGGTLSGEALNYWTSLADDKLESRVFKTGDWNTRVRVTASVQMDQRLRYAAPVSANLASPYTHRRLYDLSDRYTYQQRTESSLYSTSGLPAWNTDQTEALQVSLDKIRDACEDASISGRFTLERLWFKTDPDDERPIFMVGDQIRRLTGRDYDLSSIVTENKVYPEIVQIRYDIEGQTMHLLTRNLRLAEER